MFTIYLTGSLPPGIRSNAASEAEPLTVPHRNPVIRRRGRAALALAAVVLLGGRAAALDGRVDVRSLHNEGLTNDADFSTEILRLDFSVDQTVRLSRHLVLRADWRDLYEDSESRSDMGVTSYSTRTYLPSLDLNYRAQSLRGGLSLDGYDRDYDGPAFGRRADRRVDASAYLQRTFARGLASLRAGVTESERRTVAGELVENRDQALRGSLKVDTAAGEFLYTGSLTRDDARTAGVRRDRDTHGLRYMGDTQWQDGRGRASLELRTDRFHESVSSLDPLPGERLVPIFTGVVLDGTPEDLDPFEPSPAPLPELSDLDRDAPTSLNIGDDTPPVREFGGDYRNVVIDFGTAQAVGAGALYVDRIVRFPEFLDWRLFTSDDPEGITWTEVPAGVFRAVWREWTDGRRGWELTFTEPVAARRFKLVDVKTGPTESDLFVNEVELYDPEPVDARARESVTRRHRLVGSVGYDLSSRLRVGYRATLDRRESDDQPERDLDGAIHALDARYRLDGWTLASLYTLSTLESPSRQNTDTRSTTVSAASDAARPLWVRLSWRHDLDRSLARHRTGDDYTVDLTWNALPGLSLLQKTGHGRLDDANTGLDSRSWFTVTTLRSRPRRSLIVDLRRASRWVTREAGDEFTRFDDTEADVHWSPFPLLSYSGMVRYERRAADHWLTRHLVSWNPFSTGGMDIRFSLNHYRDTRTDSRQSGGGVQATWRARPRLRLEGRVDVQRQRRRGVETTPLNTQWRATWTF